MINQGFVTDSDTEKELKKWQQARTTAVDEDKLKQQYKNRLNNAQGQHFEREILAGCRMYESHGIATIDKTQKSAGYTKSIKRDWQEWKRTKNRKDTYRNTPRENRRRKTERRASVETINTR